MLSTYANSTQQSNQNSPSKSSNLKDSHAKSIPAYKITLVKPSQESFISKAQFQISSKVITSNLTKKKISDSKQDRLSQLTVSQIDRIVDMQKIKSLLNDKKQKTPQKYFLFQKNQQNQHHHVYQASFLTKINEIAIKRNIKGQTSEGLIPDYMGKRQKTQDSKGEFRYVKKYIKQQKKKTVLQHEQMYEREIDTIRDEYQRFQETIDMKKHKEKGLNDKQYYVKWFRGMSKRYVQNNKTSNLQETVLRPPGFDISSEIHSINLPLNSHSCHLVDRKAQDPHKKGDKFRLRRVTTICL